MTPERWQRMKALFHGALELPADERVSWVATAVKDDRELEKDVLALLRAHVAGDNPLDVPIEGTPPSSSSALDIGPALPPGTVVGAFRIEAELGRGGMGIVYLAFDERLQRPVALKALAGAAAADPTRRKRLQNEALLAATITHPGIATVYRLDQIDGNLYLATEYIAGHTLRHEMERGPVGVQRALGFVRDILQALAAAHEAGVVHRDLKPDNVMVSTAGAVKIVDFGIARSERFALTKVTSGGAPGTPAYMSPEQLAGVDADARSDLYAVGVMLAEMISGRHPGTPDIPPLPTQLQTVVDKSLMREPAGRYQSATEMLRAIEALQQPARGNVTLGWWRFHQLIAAIVYWLMIAPAWIARVAIGGAIGRVLFLSILAAVVVSSILRLHHCFSSYYYAAHLDQVRGQGATALRVADVVFVGGMVAAALLLGDDNSGLTELMLSVAIGAAVAAFFIEPATTRAAFGPPTRNH